MTTIPAVPVMRVMDAHCPDLVRAVTQPETVAEQITRTGLHPITTGAPRRPGRHAARWTAPRALEDARLGLECYQSTGRRVDRPGMLGSAFALLPHEVEAAVWTMGVLQ